MSIENQLSELIAELKNNTAALREILDAGSVSVPAAETPAAKAPAKKQAKVKLEPEVTAEPEPAAEEPAPEPELTPTKVLGDDRPQATEFNDPLDPGGTVVVVQGDPEPEKIDVDAVISQITETWKQKLTAADADEKVRLKELFPTLRTKWGLNDGDKLITLKDTPEKLVGLLDDVKKA